MIITAKCLRAFFLSACSIVGLLVYLKQFLCLREPFLFNLPMCAVTLKPLNCPAENREHAKHGAVNTMGFVKMLQTSGELEMTSASKC